MLAARRCPAPRRTSDRSRPGLRLERDVGRLRHHRPVRRDALRQRHHLPLQGPMRADADLQRRRAAGRRRPAAANDHVQETVHGPVIGYATVGGRRVAISQRRSTRGRELLNGLAFADLNANRVRSARDFTRVMSQVEFTFNWFYADDRDIAMYSSGRLPRATAHGRSRPADDRHRRLRVARLPARAAASPARSTRRSGAILNWNNKPARGFGASDSNWSYGSIHRNQLLEEAIEERREHTLHVGRRRHEQGGDPGPESRDGAAARSPACSRPARRPTPAPLAC